MRKLLTFGLMSGSAIALVVVSGIIPIAASSRHWAITEWFLDFTKRRSVATHSLTIPVPPLNDPALILKGAGHYETGCRPCHGSPGEAPPIIPSRSTPHPPDLHQQVARWQPEELFYIVKHGIKFTGMPAWPAPTRDDEVWAVVSFLRMLPRTDARTYARLVFGERERREVSSPSVVNVLPSVELIQASCDRCHAREASDAGRSAFPRLDGQRSEYTRRALEAYANGSRQSGVMAPIAARMDARTRKAVADHFASRPQPTVQSHATTPARGAEIVARGLPERGVPACSECHGPVAHDRNPAYPTLSGQYADYLFQQLGLFAEDRRGGSPFAPIMHDIAKRLTTAQMRDVSLFYESLAER